MGHIPLAEKSIPKSDFRLIRRRPPFSNVICVRSALKSWWNLPRAPDNPGILWWDRWLVGIAVVAVIIEGFFRSDMPWRPVGVVVGIIFAVALLWRRTHPALTTILVFGVVSLFNVLTLLNADWAWEIFSVVFVLLFPYTLIRWGSGREGMAGLAAVWVTYLLTIPDAEGLDEILGGAVVLALPAIIGAEVRARNTRRRRQIEQVKLMERSQLARELHDTVAHHVSAIAVQAQAGRELAKSNAVAAVETLAVIENEASKTLQEMRAMVGALRDGDDPELTPSRGVADLENLAANAGDSPPVHVDVEGNLDDLPPAVDSAIYRLAQESITNAIRHARAATQVSVHVSGDGPSLRLVVEDDGEPSLARSDSGYGLVGMEERAKLLGGSFSAGPIPGRGWRVTAVIPKSGVAG